MGLQQDYDLLNFWINKYMGQYYSPSELDLIVDRGQMALFSELRPLYGTSQRIDDALAPFLDEYNFVAANMVSGVAIVPPDRNFMALLDVQISYTESNRTINVGVPMVGKTERAAALRSQTDPVTVTSPIGEVISPRYIRFYPASGYTGTITFFRRPQKPVYNFMLISGRIPVFNPTGSQDLEWGEDFRNSVLLKALSSAGINLSDQEVAQFAEVRNQSNAANQNNY